MTGRKTRRVIWAGIAVLILFNLLLLTDVIPGGKVTSLVEQFTAQDQNIEHPLLFLWIIQGELLIAVCAIIYFLKHGKRKSISLLTGLSFLISTAMLFLSFVLYRSYDSTFLWSLYEEDHLFENLTCLFHLGSALLFLLLFFRSRRLGMSRLIPLLLFVFFFFVGMEEISWGQRILGIQTPQFMKDVNTLGETNLHNILPKENREPVYIGFFLIVSLIFIRRNFFEKRAKTSRWAAAIIPFLPPPDFFYFGLLLIAMLILPRYLVFWEVIEQIFGVICATYAIHVYRRLSKRNRENLTPVY